MEENKDFMQPTPPRRRRKRSKWQDFKEAYLPVLIALVAVILIIVFISGSVNRAKGPATESTPAASVQTTESAEALLQKEVDDLLARAAVLASQYDYEGALKVLESYSAGLSTSQELMNQYNEYTQEYQEMIPVENVRQIPNLAFNLLIADLDRALADEDYGDAFNKNYVTVTEFQAILQQLYDNGYMLVSPYDIAPKTVDADGNVTLSEGNIRLPDGKKPIVLTQTGCNYHTYMVDSDGDGLADKGGSGFASKLIIGDDGKLTNEMVDAEGNTVTGSFDIIPILNDFIELHPDFSYKGARATIAVTGYDGLFGYRTDPETATKISKEYYESELASVTAIIDKVREDGYDIACYTYDLENYGLLSSTDIQKDLDLWATEVTPLLGDIDILVYPNGGNIDSYSGNKYKILSEFGFKYFTMLDNDVRAWGQITTGYALQSRLWVRGYDLYNTSALYKDLFDSAQVLDAARSFS